MLEGWEWIIIGVVAIVIIMWGPAKIPQFAKALGQAKGEFNKASKDFSAAALATENAPTQQAATSAIHGQLKLKMKCYLKQLKNSAYQPMAKHATRSVKKYP